MNIEDFTLGRLAVANLLFSSMTSYDDSLDHFNDKTSNKIVLTNVEHRNFLLTWLNEWGCRNLSLGQHGVASNSISKWYEESGSNIITDEKPLWELGEKELDVAARAYGSLKDKTGAIRVRAGKEQVVNIGPTAASKILFAMRQKAMMPWDEAMRKRFNYDGSQESYLKYLLKIKFISLHIKGLCEKNGFLIDELPQKLERQKSTIMILINGYIWVTVTRQVTLPASSTLTRWAELD